MNSPTTQIYTLSLHDALPISLPDGQASVIVTAPGHNRFVQQESLTSRRSEEHTSELQSRRDLVCRLLLEKKKRARRPPGRPPAATPPCSPPTPASRTSMTLAP